MTVTLPVPVIALAKVWTPPEVTTARVVAAPSTAMSPVSVPPSVRLLVPPVKSIASAWTGVASPDMPPAMVPEELSIDKLVPTTPAPPAPAATAAEFPEPSAPAAPPLPPVIMPVFVNVTPFWKKIPTPPSPPAPPSASEPAPPPAPPSPPVIEDAL